MTGGGQNERRGITGSPAPAPHRFLFSIAVLLAVTVCIVIGEWKILAPFSRFLSDSADRYAYEIMPANVIRTVMERTADPTAANDAPEVSMTVVETKPNSIKRIGENVAVADKKESKLIHTSTVQRRHDGAVQSKSDNLVGVPAAVPKARSSPKEEAPFDRIVVLGERHSATFYTAKTLEVCFPEIEVSDFFVRFKHWFQPTPDFVVKTTKEYLKNDMTEEEGIDMFEIHNQWPNIAALENPKANAFKKTLLIVMSRNPYDWMETMRLQPHYWTNHASLYRFPNAPVPDAIGNPWYGHNASSWTDFLKTDMAFQDDELPETRLCQNGFLNGTVTPCLNSKDKYPPEVKKDYPKDVNEAPDMLPFNAHRPIYELDPDGKPYANPLALRTAKIRNFLDIPNKWDLGSFMTVQQEEINKNGSAFLLDKVSKLIGQKPDCEVDPPKNLPIRPIDRQFQEWITKNADWDTEGKLGYETRPVINRIVLLGERHSGTSYTTRKLVECFPRLQVSNVLGRFKHWFQPSPEYMLNVTNGILKQPSVPGQGTDISGFRQRWPELMSRRKPKAAFEDTIVIYMVRNPYDWLEAMRERPHHWPNHLDLEKDEDGKYQIQSYDWRKFLSTDMILAGDDTESAPICQHLYPFGSVSPCVFTGKNQYPQAIKDEFAFNLSTAPDILPASANDPVYELEANGKPFANPLALRTAKIKATLDLPNKWDLGGFVKVQFEDINDKGPLFLINIVAKMVGMKPECTPDPAKLQEGKQLVSDWADWITKNADWEAEKEIGYQPRKAAPNGKRAS